MQIDARLLSTGFNSVTRDVHSSRRDSEQYSSQPFYYGRCEASQTSSLLIRIFFRVKLRHIGIYPRRQHMLCREQT